MFIDLSHQFDRDSEKGFTGTLPAFDGLPNLERLDLSLNQLEGAIPIRSLDGVNTEQFPGANLRMLCFVDTFNEDRRQQADDRTCIIIPRQMLWGLTIILTKKANNPKRER
mmetsp:Transcript_50360/g.60713  ORF Transcript_50360/g.60713 Transcript_50360/m.60713 type:complete len:111 (+) Transcript_50360:247-579(+)